MHPRTAGESKSQCSWGTGTGLCPSPQAQLGEQPVQKGKRGHGPQVGGYGGAQTPAWLLFLTQSGGWLGACRERGGRRLGEGGDVYRWMDGYGDRIIQRVNRWIHTVIEKCTWINGPGYGKIASVFEDRLLPRRLGRMHGQLLPLQQHSFCIRPISISPMQPLLLLSLRPPFPSLIPNCRARPPTSHWGQPPTPAQPST